MQLQKTDRIMSVITEIKLGRKTGTLTARRSEGMQMEEGSIEFVRGMVVKAYTGDLNDLEAFNCLSGWGSCQFSFSPPSMTTPPPSTPLPSYRYPPQTDNFAPFHTTSGNLDRQTAPIKGFEAPLTPLPSSHIPRSVRPLEAGLRLIEQVGLSRSHKRLFMLIDGVRSINDLSRLLGQDPEHLYTMLRELERATIIRMSSL